MRALLSGLVLLSGILLTAEVAACPNCSPGKQARAEIWRDDFAWRVSAALLPFLLVGVVCLRAESMDRLP
jgi:hypothetical protein